MGFTHQQFPTQETFKNFNQVILELKLVSFKLQTFFKPKFTKAFTVWYKLNRNHRVMQNYSASGPQILVNELNRFIQNRPETPTPFLYTPNTPDSIRTLVEARTPSPTPVSRRINFNI